jgi:hypothetical protein
MRLINFFAHLSTRSIVIICGFSNLRPTMLSLGLTTEETLWLVITYLNSLRRVGRTFGPNLGNYLVYCQIQIVL